jgi:hypothetical protein
MGSIRSGSGRGGGGGGGSGSPAPIAWPVATLPKSYLRIPTAAEGGSPSAQPVNYDDLASAFNVTLAPGRSLDVGQTLTDPAFTSTSPLVSAVLTDNAGHAPRDLLGAPPGAYPGDTPTSFHAVGAYVKSTDGATVTWTNTANAGGSTHTGSATATWLPRLWFGVLTASQLAADDATLAATIAALSSRLQNSRGGAYSVVPGPADFGVWWIRTSLGTPIFQLAGNLPGGVSLLKSGLVVANAYGVAQAGNLFRVDNPGLGGVWTLT